MRQACISFVGAFLAPRSVGALLRCVAGLAFFTCISAGCDDACVALSEEICRCRPTEFQQQQCISRISDLASTESPSSTQRQRCEDLLDTCTCDALEAGDVSQCGLDAPAD